MTRLRFRPALGILTVASSALLAACYTFSGGSGFPPSIKTIYIEPFDNQTVQVELDQHLFRKLSDKLPRALGARPGAESNADAVVRGKIIRYEDVGQNYRPGQTGGNVDVLTYQVTITVSVEIIDKQRNLVLWDSQSVVGRGDYKRDTEKDTDAREKALDHILQQIVDGAQSQW